MLQLVNTNLMFHLPWSSLGLPSCTNAETRWDLPPQAERAQGRGGHSDTLLSRGLLPVPTYSSLDGRGH